MSEGSSTGLSLIPSDDPVLHTPAKPVDLPNFDEALPRIHAVRDFLLENGRGVGLAAPQMGIPERFFVISYGGRTTVHINPEIIKHNETTTVQNEGCLSYPGVLVPVSRFARIKVQYYTLDGSFRRHYMKDFLARIFQHELDHLDGIVHLDRAKEQGHI